MKSSCNCKTGIVIHLPFLEEDQKGSDLPRCMHSMAYLNPKLMVSPQPCKFTELTKGGPIPGLPQMAAREDPAGTDLRMRILGRVLTAAPSAEIPPNKSKLAHPSLRLIDNSLLSLRFCIRKPNSHRAEKQVFSIVSTTGQWMSLLHHRKRISTPRGP